MEQLPLEIGEQIFDIVAIDKPSLLQLSNVSKRLRDRLAPRIFQRLTIKNILGGYESGFDDLFAKIERLVQFTETSPWAVCVEALDLEMEMPEFEQVEQDGISVVLSAQEMVSASSVWFPDRLTYFLSNLASLFPSLHTLVLSFPSTASINEDVIINGEVPGADDDSDHHVLIKLLDLTFRAISHNAPEDTTTVQRIKHFSIKNYPPFGCAALSTKRSRSFRSNLSSFTVETDEEYDDILVEGAYFNEIFCDFLTETIPYSFLSQFYDSSCLEYLRIRTIPACPLGVTGFMPLDPRVMGQLKTLVLENVMLCNATAIESSSSLGSFIRANGATLEEIELIGAAWTTDEESDEYFEEGTTDHWASLWKFLADNKPPGLRKFAVNGHVIVKDEQTKSGPVPEHIDFGYQNADLGWGYHDVEEEDIPDFIKDGDLEAWISFRNSLLGIENDCD